jgi:Protein of unknown function (DUF1579)
MMRDAELSWRLTLMRRILIAVLMLALTTGVSAQSARRHKRRTQPPPPAPQIPPAKQIEEMKKMTDTFGGMWNTTATVEKNMFFSEAGTSAGHSEFRSGPAGNSLIERARSHGVMGVFAGLGVFWWDAKAAAYKAVWCDSLSRSGCDLLGTGHWDGPNLVFTSLVDMGGGNTMQMRETYSAITADSFTFTMEAAMGDAPMAKMMTIQYQRSQAKSAATPTADSDTAPADSSAPKQ